MLYSVLISPPDFDEDQIALSLITHAEMKGMSVLREAASDEEFLETINLRLARGERRFYGVSSLPYLRVRQLLALHNKHDREIGDRLYYALDTDTPGRAHHADIFATLPRNPRSAKAAWRYQRSRLLEIVEHGRISASKFRNGALLQSGS